MKSPSNEPIRPWGKALNPFEPVPVSGPASHQYVDFYADGLRGDDGSPMAQIARVIALRAPREKSCTLFSGYPGSGKTTELLRLNGALRQENQPAHVVYLEAENYL